MTDPGLLPQTSVLPPSDDSHLDGEMSSLWSGIVTGSVMSAMPAFFPQNAYLQVKSIANAAGDYQNRLVADYSLDIVAAHQLLGQEPQKASLLSVEVPESFAHWVPPGTCYNAVGYYEVPNSRIVYQVGGVTHSFGIASLISWRGEWYVVHLGAVLRSTVSGVVDDPETGPGTPAPSSTC